MNLDDLADVMFSFPPREGDDPVPSDDDVDVVVGMWRLAVLREGERDIPDSL